jgi:hypothetical protein
MWTDEEIEELKNKLKAERKLKVDYVVDSNKIETRYDVDTNTIKLRIRDGKMDNQWFNMNEWMHTQVADKSHIWKQQYDWLMENGHQELLTKNINELINHDEIINKEKKNRIIRTMGDTARALVYDGYKAIDNSDMFEYFIDIIKTLNQGGLDIVIDKCEVTQRKIYMRAVSNKLTDTIFGEVKRDVDGKIVKDGLKVGDIINGGIQISNSEVGDGSYCVEPFIMVLKCSNGLISNKAVRRRHLGPKQKEQEIRWSELTRELHDKVLWSELNDLVFDTFKPEVFREWVDSINQVASEPISKPVETVNVLVKSYKQFRKEANEALLTRFAEYGFTRWGLTQAVTDYAKSEKSFDNRVELERIGNEILLKKPIIVKEG